MKSKGFNLVELLVVIAILAILLGVASPYLVKFYKTYKFWEVAGEVDYTVKWAKIYAMKQTTNVGLCVVNNELRVYDVGLNRGGPTCSGTLIRSVRSEISSISIVGSGAMFDPRGLAIYNGSVCVSDGQSFNMQCISTAGIRTIKGAGTCPANCPQ